MIDVIAQKVMEMYLMAKKRNEPRRNVSSRQEVNLSKRRVYGGGLMIKGYHKLKLCPYFRS